MNRCSFTGCRHAAHLTPRLVVPPRGWLKGAGEIAVFVGLEVCARHFEELTAADLLVSAALRADLTAAHLRDHAAAPDFARARIEKVSVDAAVYRAHKARALALVKA